MTSDNNNNNKNNNKNVVYNNTTSQYSLTVINTMGYGVFICINTKPLIFIYSALYLIT